MSSGHRFRVEGPYDLSLSLRSSHRFTRLSWDGDSVVRTVVRVEGQPVVMDVGQVESSPPALEVFGTGGAGSSSLQQEATRMLFGELSLEPFYEQVGGHPLMGEVLGQLRGLKPSRPPSLFEMAVTAVTEQQISMAAACQIRARLVEAFGDPIVIPTAEEGEATYYAFPEPDRLVSLSTEALGACGLSVRKAEYILGLAQAVAGGDVDLDGLAGRSDEDVRAVLTDLRGFGPWSADYILLRGLGRVDCVPASDLGVRTVVGGLLGDGSRMGAEEVRSLLAPFEPYRGLAAFYLLRYAGMDDDRTS